MELYQYGKRFGKYFRQQTNFWQTNCINTASTLSTITNKVIHEATALDSEISTNRIGDWIPAVVKK